MLHAPVRSPLCACLLNVSELLSIMHAFKKYTLTLIIIFPSSQHDNEKFRMPCW